MIREGDLANLAEITAEELIERGTYMTALGRELLGICSALKDSNEPVPDDATPKLDEIAERSVGRYGAVTEDVALNAARDLRSFDVAQFSQALGLTGMTAPDTMKWLSILLKRDPPVLTRDSPGHYRYLDHQ